jgi:hypothetical protein
VWIVLLLGLLISAACGAPQPTVVGDWQKIDGSGFDRYSFEADGRVGFGTTGDMCTGRYQFSSSTRLRLTIAHPCSVKELSIEVHISETTLSITTTDGTTSHYRRAPHG